MCLFWNQYDTLTLVIFYYDYDVFVDQLNKSNADIPSLPLNGAEFTRKERFCICIVERSDINHYKRVLYLALYRFTSGPYNRE